MKQSLIYEALKKFGLKLNFAEKISPIKFFLIVQ